MADDLERLKTALADRYTIERELGEGGMATVYLAHDLKHDRRVALKVLRPELSAVIGPDRFLQEIRLTANLHHPHIVQLYDSGEAEGALYYVMPWVEGETLRQKLARESQLAVHDAVAITRAVADALDYAHRRNVIHRDIKPENILLQEGTPLVADFGIALAVSRGAGERLTQSGLSVGTPFYMSPEQATGDRQLDARTDVYALGSVLYEMLAGDPPFMGSNVQAVIAKVVGERPVKLRVIRGTVPANVEQAVDRALAKVPADRFPSARAFADALTASLPATEPELSDRARPSRARLAYGVPALAVIGALAWVLLRPGGAATDAGARSIRPLTSFIGWEWAPSWSPDGSQIAYSHIVGSSADVATLSTRGGDPHILTAASPADEFAPRWSPDGTRIAYASDRGGGTNIYWIPPTGGAERKLAETHIPFLERLWAWAGCLGTAPWSPDGRAFVFSRLLDNGDVALWKLELATGAETQLTFPPGGAEDLFGAWSPDGRWISFSRGEKGKQSLWLVPPEGGQSSLLLGDEHSNGHSAWMPDSRRLVFSSTRSGTFNIWEIDVRTRNLRQLTAGAGFDMIPSVAGDGSIAYVQFGHQVDINWLPTDGDGEPQQLTSFTGENFGARVSSDGERVVYYSIRSGNYDLWLLDRATGLHRQLTDHPAADRLPDWSPDGSEVVFMSDRSGAVALWIVETESGLTRRLTNQELPWAMHTAESQGGPRWAPEGSAIAYIAPVEQGSVLWLVRSDGDDPHPTTIRGPLSFGWYRDGGRVIYTRRAPDGSGKVELRAANLSTGEDRLLRAGSIAEATVSPRGDALSYLESVSHFTMDLHLLPLTPAAAGRLPRVDGEPRKVTFGEGKWHVHNGGWAPDGDAVVYSTDRDFGDIYVIEPEP